MESPRQKIRHLALIFGISTEIQAKAMKISIQSVYNKYNQMKDEFNENNFQNLKKYLLDQLEQIKEL